MDLPAAQEVQDAAPAAEYLPAEQETGDTRPVVPQYLPAMQVLQAFAVPEDPVYVVVGQLVQAVLPVPAENLPAAQLDTDERPVVAQYLPAWHAVQLSAAPVEGAYWPATQFVHAVAPAAENLPTAHAASTAVSPVVEQYEPAVQSGQASEEPDEAANVPAAQSTQASLAAFTYVPAAQLVQAEAPAACANLPAAQAVGAVSPVVPQYEPRVQVVHTSAATGTLSALPEVAWNWPVGQFVQAVAPADDDFPAAHGLVTVSSPVVPQNEPAVQVVQVTAPVPSENWPAAQGLVTAASPVVAQ